MATKKESEQIVKDEGGLQDDVIFELPLIPGVLEDDVFLGINGRNCVIKRGVPVRISRARAEVLTEEMRLNIVAENYKGQVQNLNF